MQPTSRRILKCDLSQRDSDKITILPFWNMEHNVVLKSCCQVFRGRAINLFQNLIKNKEKESRESLQRYYGCVCYLEIPRKVWSYETRGSAVRLLEASAPLACLRHQVVKLSTRHRNKRDRLDVTLRDVTCQHATRHEYYWNYVMLRMKYE